MMIKNYFLASVRNFWKNRTTSIIKIIGLAIGLSAVLLIYIYINFQYSYDNYHKNGDRIYRVAYHLENPSLGKWNEARTGHNLAYLLKNNFPEIEETSRVTWFGEVNILHKNQQFKESKLLFADPSILKIFSFPMKIGDPENALNEPNSIIISSKIASKYFGNENPIGKYLGDTLQLKVTGIIDIPDNSHFRFDILASYPTIYNIFPFYKNYENKNHSDVFTYLMLRKGVIAFDLGKKLPQFLNSSIKEDIIYKSTSLFLEPLTKIQTKGCDAYYGELNLTKFTEPIIYLFSILGLIIIGIACFNFINISIAQISERTKEIGVRKVYGAKRLDIFFQFICEYWLYSMVAIFISIYIVQAFLPLVSQAINRHLEINYLNYTIAAAIVLLSLTILSGAYPSIIVAKINPVKALQRSFKGPKGSLMRSVLVVSQFTVSTILLLITLYISKQIKYLTEMDMGIETGNILVVNMYDSKVRAKYEILKSELLKNTNILSVSASSNIPGVTGAKLLNIKIEEGEERSIFCISIDAEFIKNLGVKTIGGRSFVHDLQTDVRTSYLLSKSAVKELGIENPVGKSIILYKDQNGRSVPDVSGQIIGIIDDYNYRPNYETSRGAIFVNDPSRFNAMLIHFSSNNNGEIMNLVKQTWEKIFQNTPFTADYLESEIKNDQGIKVFTIIQRFIIVAANFSLLVALLGLFGLSIFTAKQRTKEIGIRRVNGATVKELLVLMNRKFINLVIFSAIISIPIVELAIEAITKDDGKSATLTIFDYACVSFSIITISLITVCLQSWKTATKNPVEALRYE